MRARMLLPASLMAVALALGACGKEEEGRPAPAPAAPADTAPGAAPAEAPAPPPVPAAPAQPPGAAGAGTPAAVEGDAAAGKSVYDNTCATCHATGVAGAPKLGDRAAWGPRIARGEAALMETLLKGKGAMPPRGACSACSDPDLRNALAYMLEQVR